MNKVGLCINCNELEKVGFGLALWVIDETGPNRTPVPFTLESTAVIQGVMDNFIYDEGTSSDIGISQDTTLMLLLIRQNNMEELQKKASQKMANSWQNQSLLLRKMVNFKVIFTWSQDFLSAVNGSAKEHQPCGLACCQFICKIKDGSIDILSLTAMKSYCCWYPSSYKIHLSNLLPFLFTQWQNMIPYSLQFSISRPFSISKAC